MALESGVTYIEDLVATNPNEPDNDTLDEADNHLRIIKTAVQGSFPSLGSAAVTKTAAEINDLATVTGSETLTNKTLTSPTINTGVLNSPTLVTPALGTPASGVLTNCTGTASGLTAGNVTTNANLTGPVTSVGNATTLTSNSVTSSPLAVASTGGNRTVGATSTLLIPAGWYVCMGQANTTIEIKDASSIWRDFSAAGNGGTLWSDGSNMRWSNVAGSSVTVYYRKFD